MKDVIVIGAGPAGLSAALYAARAGLSVQLFDARGGGGQLTEIAEIENYLGVERVGGAALVKTCLAQAMAAGAELMTANVIGAVREGASFSVCIDQAAPLPEAGGAFRARTLILANGAEPRRLRVSGEAELLGRGVSYCAVCDGRFFGGKTVAVIGGGGSALAEALYLSRMAAAVHIVHRSRHFRAERALFDRLSALPNVILHTERTVRCIKGGATVEAVDLCDAVTGLPTESLRVDGVFVAIGREPRNQPFAALFPLDERGYVMTDESCSCATEGLFAAGDTRVKQLRQVSTAVADGANAAEAARRYLVSHAFG